MKIKSGFVLENVGNGYLACVVGERAADFSALVKLNNTGAFLFRQLSECDLTRDELVDRLLSEYDVPRELAERDIDAFVLKLSDSGILDK